MSVAQTTARAARQARPKPKYIARCKVGNGWVTVGAAWDFRSGDEGLSVQLTTMPLNWDGRLILLPPLENGEDPEPRDE